MMWLSGWLFLSLALTCAIVAAAARAVPEAPASSAEERLFQRPVVIPWRTRSVLGCAAGPFGFARDLRHLRTAGRRNRRRHELGRWLQFHGGIWS